MIEPTPPIGAARSTALGCAGFVGFFVFAGTVGGALGEGAAGMVITLLAVGLAILWGAKELRGASAHTRAVAVRVAIGFVVGLLLFGGCLAVIANTNFH